MIGYPASAHSSNEDIERIRFCVAIEESESKSPAAITSTTRRPSNVVVFIGASMSGIVADVHEGSRLQVLGYSAADTSHRSTDRTQASEACNVGSIPAGRITTISAPHYYRLIRA